MAFGVDRDAAASGSGSGSTTIDVSIIDAKGDLLAGTASDTVDNLAVGADGEIIFPAPGATTGLAWLRFPSSGAIIVNGKVSRSVAGSALTVALKTLADTDPSTSSPVFVLMPTITSSVFDGGYVVRKVTAALSMAVSSGSTLGHASATASAVYIYLLDNAGTLEFAVSNKFFGGVSVQSSTAEGGAGAADTGTTLYSTTARASVAVACLQRWKSTQTTAGTWAATTGEVQLFPFPYKAPVLSTLTAGSGTYTTPWDALAINVALVGGGAGGGASTTNNGTAGNNSTFGSLTANGGSGGGNNGQPGGAGGGASGGDINLTGGSGGGGNPGSGATFAQGGSGGSSFFGGGGQSSGNAAGTNAPANSGAGGGGAGGQVGGGSGGAGGAGGYCRKLFVTPLPTFAYGVGAAANGGAAGVLAGGNGGSGLIVIEEQYA